MMTARPTLPPVASRSGARHSWARSPSASHQRMPREFCSSLPRPEEQLGAPRPPSHCAGT
eukprot:272748-Pyramimonas_sp.AAC.1